MSEVEIKQSVAPAGTALAAVISPISGEIDEPNVSSNKSQEEQSATELGNRVSRQMSRNSTAPALTTGTFQSVGDFLSAYNTKKKTIDDLTDKFVEKAGEAKQAQDDIIPHLAFMQLGTNTKDHGFPTCVAVSVVPNPA